MHNAQEFANCLLFAAWGVASNCSVCRIGEIASHHFIACAFFHSYRYGGMYVNAFAVFLFLCFHHIRRLFVRCVYYTSLSACAHFHRTKRNEYDSVSIQQPLEPIEWKSNVIVICMAANERTFPAVCFQCVCMFWVSENETAPTTFPRSPCNQRLITTISSHRFIKTHLASAESNFIVRCICALACLFTICIWLRYWRSLFVKLSKLIALQFVWLHSQYFRYVYHLHGSCVYSQLTDCFYSCIEETKCLLQFKHTFFVHVVARDFIPLIANGN